MDSLYFIKSGGTVRTPLVEKKYDWWQREEQHYAASTTPRPTFIIRGPDFEWILWPTPSAAGTVYGEWTIEPEQLLNADDTPCWRPHYNELLKWGVIRMYATEFTKEGISENVLARAAQEFPVLWAAFERDYLPEPYGARSLF